LSIFVAFLGIGGIIVYLMNHDLENKISRQMIQNMAAIESCRQEYHLNKCSPETMVQALKEFCKKKEVCMYSNPYSNIERSTLAF
jgi:16S rRNA C1402 N4-methylase RsmH